MAFLLGQTQNSAAYRPGRYGWAELLKKVFLVDVLKYDRCGRRMQILCAINLPDAIRKILDYLGLATKSLSVSPAKGEGDLAEFPS
jgi:hypothetical protein